jgi:hypothetical protein
MRNYSVHAITTDAPFCALCNHNSNKDSLRNTAQANSAPNYVCATVPSGTTAYHTLKRQHILLTCRCSRQNGKAESEASGSHYKQTQQRANDCCEVPATTSTIALVLRTRGPCPPCGHMCSCSSADSCMMKLLRNLNDAIQS